MKIKIQNSSTYVKNVLLSTNQHGTVHSVYNKTINLSFHSKLFSIQSEASPLSPISLISNLSVGEFSKINISVGQAVSINSLNKMIEFSDSDICLDLSETCFFPSKLINCNQRMSNNLKNLLYDILLRNTSNGFRTLFVPSVTSNDEIQNTLIQQYAKSTIETCTRHLKERLFYEAAVALRHLIGLGIGLTPSGDDFLCGVFAGLIMTHGITHPFLESLHSEIQNHLFDTNDISRSFLECALLHEFGTSVHMLLQEERMEKIQEAFESIGHSSGIDSLCGIYYVACISHYLD